MPLTLELDHAICKCQVWSIHYSWYLQCLFTIDIIIVIIFLFTWGLNVWGLWQERSVHLESVRFNAQSHQPRSAKSTCLLPAAAVQTPVALVVQGLCKDSSKTVPSLWAHSSADPWQFQPQFQKETGLKWHSHRKQMYFSLCLRQHSFHHEKENTII